MDIQALNRTALIEAVAAEVLKRLQQVQTTEPIANSKKAILLSVEPVPALESILNPYYEVRYYDESVRDCDLLIIPKMCIGLLSYLANGISAGTRERFVLTMLLKGKQVVVLEEGLLYRKYKQTSPVMLYKLYNGFANKLQSYGITTVRESDLLSACLEDERLTENQEEVHSEGAHVDMISQSEVLTSKVITEADVKKYRLQNVKEIVVGRHSIITPLAQDYLHTHQMRVRRR
ncbi:ethanolamine utilization protein [Paenibacillus lentus]|uniref:ethanolamine utilization protein n=1 Tax=Paenibacillus lentus TaxID=1338368 RepID=UPI003646FA44